MAFAGLVVHIKKGAWLRAETRRVRSGQPGRCLEVGVQRSPEWAVGVGVWFSCSAVIPRI